MAAMLMVPDLQFGGPVLHWANPRRFASGGSLAYYAGFPAVYVCGNGAAVSAAPLISTPWARGEETTQKGLLVLHVELCCCPGVLMSALFLIFMDRSALIEPSAGNSGTMRKPI